eukprot:7268230-Lingulodinium_polyedra.AAC.1
MQFNAAVPLSDDAVERPVAEGVKVLPMQWVETDKNAHERQDNDFGKVPRLLKSRLVGCGNFEETNE